MGRDHGDDCDTCWGGVVDPNLRSVWTEVVLVERAGGDGGVGGVWGVGTGGLAVVGARGEAARSTPGLVVVGLVVGVVVVLVVVGVVAAAAGTGTGTGSGWGWGRGLTCG